MPIVSVNGLQMYYELHGAGQPLALIEGLGTDLSGWSTIIEPLAQSHQVIAFDIHGAGRTDKLDEPYTIEQMADDTAGLLDALGIAQSKYPQPRYAYERQRAASTHYDCTARLPQIQPPKAAGRLVALDLRRSVGREYRLPSASLAARSRP